MKAAITGCLSSCEKEAECLSRMLRRWNSKSVWLFSSLLNIPLQSIWMAKSMESSSSHVSPTQLSRMALTILCQFTTSSRSIFNNILDSSLSPCLIWLMRLSFSYPKMTFGQWLWHNLPFFFRYRALTRTGWFQPLPPVTVLKPTAFIKVRSFMKGFETRISQFQLERTVWLLLCWLWLFWSRQSPTLSISILRFFL